MGEPIIVMCAPNGARRSKADHETIPLSRDEIVVCAQEVMDAGCAILHLHIRDENGRHSLDVDTYRQTIEAIKDRLGDNLIIQVTTEAVGRYTPQEQANVIRRLRPEAASLALRELCPSEAYWPYIKELCLWMQDNSVHPQFILYSKQEIEIFVRLLQNGTIVSNRPFVLLVIGSHQRVAEAVLETMNEMTALAQRYNFKWALCGFGAVEYVAAQYASQNGGHIRVGFENNIWDKDGQLVDSNKSLIINAAHQALRYQRPVATAQQARDLLHMA
ncbi:MAG: 3-keto-5-aminohexanoate cleavage protein [bacterium]